MTRPTSSRLHLLILGLALAVAVSCRGQDKPAASESKPAPAETDAPPAAGKGASATTTATATTPKETEKPAPAAIVDSTVTVAPDTAAKGPTAEAALTGKAPAARAGVPAGATAECNDGSYSMSQQKATACSGHGDVKKWLKRQ